MKTMFNLLIYVASLLGLESAADKVDLNQVLLHAYEELEKVARCHNIKLSENYYKELRDKFLELSSDSKIDEAVAMGLIKNAKLKLVFGEPNDTKNLPDILKDLGHIYYLNSVSQQDWWSCGYWSVFNAEAVDYLVANRLCLTSRSIQNRAKTHWPRIKRRAQLEVNEVNYVARYIPFDGQKLNQHTIKFLYENIDRAPENKVHILLKDVSGDNGKDTEIGSNIWPACCYTNGPHMEEVLKKFTANDKPGKNSNNFDPAGFESVFTAKRRGFFDCLKSHFSNQYVKPNQPGALHFICNLNGGFHWVLISVVKLHNLDKPILVILDSFHSSLTGDFLEYVLFLHNQFIKPYIDVSNNDI